MPVTSVGVANVERPPSSCAVGSRRLPADRAPVAQAAPRAAVAGTRRRRRTVARLRRLNSQDASRLCLTHALVHGTPDDRRLHRQLGRQSPVPAAIYYANKAPGMSVLEVPAAEATRTSSALKMALGGPATLWIVRVLSSGIGLSRLCVPRRPRRRGDCTPARRADARHLRLRHARLVVCGRELRPR